MSNARIDGAGLLLLGFLFLVVMGFAAWSFTWTENDSETGEDSVIYKICSDDYPIGFWMVKYKYVKHKSYYKAEKMTETEYALYCGK